MNEREDVQKKTFTKWMNSYLSKRSEALIQDLFVDLRDGTKLISLLEILCNRQIKREKGRLKVHHLNNVGQALEVLELNNVKLVNISTNDIVDGNPKLTLGLVWSIILHWQVHGLLKAMAQDMQHQNLEKTLLSWCRSNTSGYEGVDITNFTTSWSDGLAFNALLHRFRPHLFDYKSLLKKDANSRLIHAFDFAFRHLQIEKLLDTEDINTSRPDKKSVMMYVMCFFKALQNDSADTSDSKCEASSSDLDQRKIAEYQSNLEDILTWMLGAEEQLNNCEPIANKELETVKHLFHDNELFMIELSHYQQKIEEMFSEGQQLIRSDVCDSDERDEISLQMELLNARWDQLRFKAMERQQQLNDSLMNLQQKQLDSLREWLTSAEVKICDFSNIGANLAAVKDQLKQHKLLMKQVEQQQEVVNLVSNMVVINDDSNSDNDFGALEDQLEALAERWRHVCRFVEDTGNTLHTIYNSWKILNEEEKKFSQWLTKLDRRLTEMEDAATETSPGSKFVLDLVKRLQRMESEMECQQTNSSNLADQAQILLARLTRGSDAAQEITRNLDRLMQHWDAILQRMEQLGETLNTLSQPASRLVARQEGDLLQHWDAILQRMEQLGETLNTLSQPASRSSTSSQASSPDKKEISSSETSSTASTPTTTSAKKRRLDSWRIQEWQRALDTLSSWLERVEEALGIDTDDEEGSLLWESLAIEEQQVLLEDTEADVELRKTEFEQLISQGKQIVDDLTSIGEDSQTIEEVVHTILERWIEVNQVLDERQQRVIAFLEVNRIHSESDAMTRVLETHHKWLETAEEAINKAEELPKLLDQSKLRLKSMQSQKEKVQKITEDVLRLCVEIPSSSTDSAILL
ncbi:unnamed protein product [Medioppia subpectinata]|uniref:Calponin-homology (CH) domain-containing protein n=1 Tax=Medioppia subpectinata TaxID=1979941 RepID=A0A7R9KYI8_9ACAR|nr:unnamed protein product [Medioppia subpectinata]CAG2110939.1 unnamed protein product [Medioppia subpectinata]